MPPRELVELAAVLVEGSAFDRAALATVLYRHRVPGVAAVFVTLARMVDAAQAFDEHRLLSEAVGIDPERSEQRYVPLAESSVSVLASIDDLSPRERRTLLAVPATSGWFDEVWTAIRSVVLRED
jgi:hypothetical protein